MLEYEFVSVVVPAYNDARALKKTLVSLNSQTYPKDKFEIIAVDDGSADDTRECVESTWKINDTPIIYLTQAHKGPAAARNLGIVNARGSIIAFVDSDCVAAADWLEKISDGYDDAKIAGIGGRIMAAPTSSEISRYCAYIGMNERPEVDKTGIRYLITGNASFRKECLLRVGGFDERYDFAGGEDPNICYRLRELGYIFQYNPSAVVYNAHKHTFRQLIATYFNYGKGESFLALRRLSEWDLISVTGAKRFFYFLKAMAKMALMFLDNLTLFIKFLKVPFRALSYYADGLTFREGIMYALLDYARIFFFIQGCFFGYMTGKLKGFKKSDRRKFL